MVVASCRLIIINQKRLLTVNATNTSTCGARFGWGAMNVSGRHPVGGSVYYVETFLRFFHQIDNAWLAMGIDEDDVSYIG